MTTTREPLADLYARLRKLTEAYIGAARKTGNEARDNDSSEMNEIESEIRDVRAMIEDATEQTERA